MGKNQSSETRIQKKSFAIHSFGIQFPYETWDFASFQGYISTHSVQIQLHLHRRKMCQVCGNLTIVSLLSLRFPPYKLHWDMFIIQLLGHSFCHCYCYAVLCISSLKTVYAGHMFFRVNLQILLSVLMEIYQITPVYQSTVHILNNFASKSRLNMAKLDFSRTF